jgi:hypothetical protein
MKLKKIPLLFLVFLFLFITLFSAVGAKAADPNAFAVNSCTDIFSVIKGINTRAAGGQITGAWDIFGQAECITWAIISFLLEMGTIVAAFFIIIGSIKYMLAVGNSTKQKAAVGTINSAVIGFALLMVSWSGFSYFVHFMEYNSYVDQASKINIKIENH